MLTYHLEITIRNAILKECGDKGISVVRHLRCLLSKIELSNSEIGIASKDSSLTKLKRPRLKMLRLV